MEVTPELSDGYEGVVRKIVCLNCQHPFYIAKDVYEHIDARYCHACSLQRIGVERRRTKRPVPKEAVDQAEQGIQHAQAEDVKKEREKHDRVRETRDRKENGPEAALNECEDRYTDGS